MNFVREKDGMHCNAAFSPGDRTYRYVLIRNWDYFHKTRGLVVFIGLNPSTADETEDDPTIRRCIGFARDWGFGGLAMLNLFAFRATDPKAMLRAPEPIGPDNDDIISRWVAKEAAGLVVACWGAHGDHDLRGRQVTVSLREKCRDRLRVFGLTKDGHPKHPLYLPRAQRLEAW